jgi:hypothetical protein
MAAPCLPRAAPPHRPHVDARRRSYSDDDVVHLKTSEEHFARRPAAAATPGTAEQQPFCLNI